MSKTQTKISTEPQIAQPEEQPAPRQKKQRTLILKLQDKPKPRVTWTQDTIDNEHMNKQKSNLCCIYHRPGESSSDTCTSDDEGNAMERDRHTKHLHKKKCSKFVKKDEAKQGKGAEEGGKGCGSGACGHGH